jgi:hypothetical protein
MIFLSIGLFQANTKHHPKAAPLIDASGQARKPAPENGALEETYSQFARDQSMTLPNLGSNE